jgi:hypothetical protein
MDLIVELKITNLSDWIMLQPLLQRLQIAFVQKTEIPPVSGVTNPSQTALFEDFQGKSIPIWSPYEAQDAAEILLQAMKNNSNSTKSL